MLDDIIKKLKKCDKELNDITSNDNTPENNAVINTSITIQDIINTLEDYEEITYIKQKNTDDVYS